MLFIKEFVLLEIVACIWESVLKKKCMLSCTPFSGSDEVEKCICILQSSCINMHSIEGKDYIASLPFQVSLSVSIFLCFIGDYS